MADRIERQILVKAPRPKVWQALTDAKQFATWFGTEIEGEFAPGASVWMISRQAGYEGRFEIRIEEMTPELRLSWHWHPGAPGRVADPDLRTQVLFELSDVPGGTLLTVAESGFEAIPAHERGPAFEGNERGWEIQLGSIKKYVG